MSSKSVSKPEPEHVPVTEAQDDDLIVAPKGQSKVRFLLILGLMVFTLIMFVIPSAFQSSMGGNRSSVGETILSWNAPGGETIECDWASFIDTKRRMDDFFRVQGRRVDITDDDVAVFLVLDELARREGIEVSNQELANAILSGHIRPYTIWALPPFQSKDTYDQVLASYRIKPQRFERTVRQVLRVERYKAFLTAAASWPEPSDIEESWKEDHQEFAYEYVQIAATDFEDEAGAALPSDEELATWYEELPARQSVFQDDFRQEKVAAALIGVRADGDEAGAGLLERFPRPADENLDELAQTYYDEVAHRRFVRPEPLEDEQEARTRLYFPFEEVAEQAKREAPLQRAMTEWLQDVSQRAANGDELDLETEAAELGLWYSADGVARENQEWNELEGLGGPFIASALRSAGPNGLTLDVCADKGGLFVGYVTERTEAGLPEFAEIRDRVVEEWTKNEAAELALAAAEEFRTALADAAEVVEPAPMDDESEDGEEDAAPVGPVVEAAAFLAAAEAAGFTVGTRDWLAGYTFEPFDFQGQQFMLPKSPVGKDPNGENPANKYIDNVQSLEDLAEGGLSEAALDTDREYAYVVRSLGSRDPVEMRMSRDDWDSARNAALVAKAVDFEKSYFSRERFESTYDLELKLEDENEGSLRDEESEEDAEEPGA